MSSSKADAPEGADERERLQAYLQAYVQSGGSAVARTDDGGTTAAHSEEDSDDHNERGGLMARLEGEIWKLAKHFPLPRFAIQTWLRLF